MAILSVRKPFSDGGTAFTPDSANGGGDSFDNDGKVFFYIKNGGGAGITVTFDSPNTCNFNLSNNAAHDLAVSVGAGAEKMIGPFPVPRFNDVNNRVQVTYSGVSSVTVAPIREA